VRARGWHLWDWVQGALFVLAGAGMLVLAIQLAATLLHPRSRMRRTRDAPGISILKPLCGVDDGLEENLAAFVRLDYPDYELLLGVKDAGDPAYPSAVAAAARFPSVCGSSCRRDRRASTPR
jgi:ceramide glucosyltransferase